MRRHGVLRGNVHDDEALGSGGRGNVAREDDERIGIGGFDLVVAVLHDAAHGVNVGFSELELSVEVTGGFGSPIFRIGSAIAGFRSRSGAPGFRSRSCRARCGSRLLRFGSVNAIEGDWRRRADGRFLRRCPGELDAGVRDFGFQVVDRVRSGMDAQSGGVGIRRYCFRRGARANDIDGDAIGMLREIFRLKGIGIANAALSRIVVNDGRGNGGVKRGGCGAGGFAGFRAVVPGTGSKSRKDFDGQWVVQGADGQPLPWEA